MNAFEPSTRALLRPAFKRLAGVIDAAGITYNPETDFKDNYNNTIFRFFENDTPFFPCNSETVSDMKKRETRSEAFAANPFEYVFTYAPIDNDGPYGYQQV